jgi:hypothetical protein
MFHADDDEACIFATLDELLGTRRTSFSTANWPSSRGFNDGAARVEDREPRRRRVDGREDPIRAGFATLFMEHTRIAARPPICPSLR